MKFYHLGNIGYLQPLDTFAGILYFVSIILLSFHLSLKFKLHKNENINFIIFYIILLILISQLMFLLSFLDFNLLRLRKILIVIPIIAILLSIKNYNILIYKIKSIKPNIYFIPLILFFLLCLSPVSDSDSLDYHLGYGLNVVNNNSFSPRYDWTHYMLSSHREFLNLFGILIGSPNFMHLVQFSSIFIILISFVYIKKRFNSKFNYYLFLYSTPLLLWFVTSNKSQLFISATFLLVFILFIELLKNYNNKNIFCILIFLTYSVVNKSSFIVPGFFVFLMLIFYLKDHQKKYFIYFSLVTFIFLIFPFIFKNYYFYQDPFPPMFESFKENPSKSILSFKHSISTDNAGFLRLSGFEKLLVPILLVVPTKIALFTALIGIGFLNILLCFKINFKKIENQYLIFFIITTFISFILINNFQPRYYLEIYWAIGLLFLINYNFIKSRIKKLIYNLMLLETLVVSLAAIIGILTLSVGSINKTLYHKVMSNSATNYDEIQWIYEHVNNDEIIASESTRSNILFKSPFISRSGIFHGNNFSIEKLKRYKIDYLVFNYPFTDKKFSDFIKKCSNKNQLKRKKFFMKTRNIFSEYRKVSYELILAPNNCR